jgi:hypothetical protein
MSSIKKYQLDCAYIISKFEHHLELKDILLEQINTSEYENPQHPVAEVNITKADWHISSNFNREWVKTIYPLLSEKMLEMYKELGYDGLTIHELWFQQYQKNSQHGWHTHSANFTNVYYLELPDSAPKTQIVNPYNQTDIIEIEVEEGDILVFPSFVIHRAPINTSTNRKTIISYNTNAVYSDTIYGKGLINNAVF